MMRYAWMFACVLGLQFSVAGHAQVRQDEDLYYEKTRYACTGVGESKEDPRWAAYPVKLMFTTGGTAYVAHVDVEIKNSAGKTLLQASCNAPWLVVDLPPGNYQMTATAVKKYLRTTRLKVEAGKKTAAVVRFAEISGDQN